MSEQIVVFGYGPVGKAAVERLHAQGRQVRVAQRSRPAELPDGVDFVACDVLQAGQVMRIVAGADQVVVTIGFAYDGEVWRQSWPLAMSNLLAACEVAGARMVFLDNLYMYGPQDTPLREDTPLTSFGAKPAVRAEITRQWMAAATAGRVRVAALRAPDFYGPGVGLSHIGDVGFGAIARGKRAFLIAPPDMPHDFAYVPDVGRAIVSLLDATDDAFGQVWHMPSAPTLTPRQILEIGARAIGMTPKISALPLWLLPAIGLFVPLLRGMVEMRFQWDRPYHVDAAKFKARFWSDVTPFEVGAAATARAFKAAAAGKGSVTP
ncbi:NAD-dependent epimerase/dehydratase family protein [Phreatobacter aquaticus]|uniref:NAD-dependent epimerase/dehydratase family protein n=1 Tax=Phreatobacter aquaticus TaxID=2570229 RepID=A0A4D7QNZ3_9HYPH|nr:NAD-dependent epimerase/dehydratase family protein [Phreatobacter aquaticus]QCK87004.1 NAD-dependent epimerase/dehydratase family protein [Phreatobacter aquaticus]